MKLETGMLVKSKAGRDKDKIYAVVYVENEYVYVADGEKRPLRHAKRKNSRHLQPILKMGTAGGIDDSSICEAIRQYAARAGCNGNTPDRGTSYESLAEGPGRRRN